MQTYHPHLLMPWNPIPSQSFHEAFLSFRRFAPGFICVVAKAKLSSCSVLIRNLSEFQKASAAAKNEFGSPYF